MSFIYKRSETHLWTVGHISGENFHPESDHGSEAEAIERMQFLNGVIVGKGNPPIPVVNISLRDMFASHAMIGMLAYPGDPASGSWRNNSSPEAVAKQAYLYADAMLAARNEKPS